MFADDGLDDDIDYPKKDTTDANMHRFDDILSPKLLAPVEIWNQKKSKGWQLGPLKKLKINMHWLVGARVKYVDEGLIFLRL